LTLSGTKNATCFVCGPDNLLGLQVPFEPNGEAGSTATYIARKGRDGWNGILHGVTFSLMDEAFGWCLYFQRIPAVTVTRQRRKLFDARAEVGIDNANSPLAAESYAALYTVPAPGIGKHRNQWRPHEQHGSGIQDPRI
jgi:hypothetical protein